MAYRFIFGDTDSIDLGIMVEGTPDLDYAEYDGERVSVPGKSGDIFIDKGRYKNVDFQREINVIQKGSKTVSELVEDIVEAFAYLHGYQEFSETTRGDLITEAILENFGSVKRDLRRLGKATLKFNRKPFWFDATGLQFTDVSLVPETPTKVLTNPFKLISKPIIEINPSTTTPTTVEYSITDSSGTEKTYSVITPYGISPVVIDCEKETIKAGTTLIEGITPDGFPQGISTFKLLSDKSKISSIKIKPRWRCL